MSRHRFVPALLLAAALCPGQEVAGPGSGVPPEGVHRVSASIFRSSQPDLSAFPEIAAMGIRTVVSLRPEGEASEERAAATAAGLTYVQIGMHRHGRPRDEAVRRILETITAEKNQPVLVHCKRGADRTGVVVACYRIGFEGWSAEAALEEAEKYGLGWWQLGMRRFIRESCGEALRDAGSPDDP